MYVPSPQIYVPTPDGGGVQGDVTPRPATPETNPVYREKAFLKEHALPLDKHTFQLHECTFHLHKYTFPRLTGGRDAWCKGT